MRDSAHGRLDLSRGRNEVCSGAAFVVAAIDFASVADHVYHPCRSDLCEESITLYGDSHLGIRSAIRSDFVAAILSNSFSIACNCDETWSANLRALPATGRPIPFFLTTDHNEHTETDPRSFMSYFRVFRVFRGSMAFGSYAVQQP